MFSKALVATSFLCVLLSPAGIASAERAAGCTPGWTLVDSPNPPPSDTNLMFGISGTWGGDIWTVGQGGGTLFPPTPRYGFSEHWDGGAWSMVRTLKDDRGPHELHGVVATDDGGAWAVGVVHGDTHDFALVERFAGGKWHVVDTPQPRDHSLINVAMIDATDMWAVGHGVAGTPPLAEHWDGGSWSVVPTAPTPFRENFFLDVSGVSSSDVWAVGFADNFSAPVSGLVEHWDGGAWSLVDLPDTGDTTLTGVEALAADDVWAVGVANAQSLTMHFDGTSWTVVSSPSPGPDTLLTAIAGASPTDLWAIGRSASGTPAQTLTLHWDGVSWEQVPSPNVGTGANELWDVTVTPDGAVWAVGDSEQTSPSGWDTLTMSYCPGA